MENTREREKAESFFFKKALSDEEEIEKIKQKIRYEKENQFNEDFQS